MTLNGRLSRRALAEHLACTAAPLTWLCGPSRAKIPALLEVLPLRLPYGPGDVRDVMGWPAVRARLIARPCTRLGPVFDTLSSADESVPLFEFSVADVFGYPVRVYKHPGKAHWWRQGRHRDPWEVEAWAALYASWVAESAWTTLAFRGAHMGAGLRLARWLRGGVAPVIAAAGCPYHLDESAASDAWVSPDGDTWARLSDHPDWAHYQGQIRTGEFWATVGEDWVGR